MDDAVRDAAVRPRQDRAFHAGVRSGLRRQHRGDRGHRRRARRKPTFANTIEALERAGRGLDRAAGVFYNLAGTDTNDEIQKIEREVAPRFAKHGMRVYQNAKLFRRVDALFKKQGQPRPQRGAGARAGALSPQLHPLRRGARCQGAQAAWRRSPQRLATLGTKFSQNVLADEQDFLLVLEVRGGACRPARGGAGGGGADGQRARPQGQARHQPVALQHRAVPAVLGAARPARAGVQGLAAARRQRRQDRQPQDRRRDPEPAGRARAPAGLQDGGRRGARVHHGQDAGQRAQAADGGVEAGAQARAPRSATQLQAGRAGRGRQLQAGGLGLALLRREGAQDQVRRRRGGGEALPAARQRHRRRLRRGHQAVRRDASTSAPTCPSIIPTCAASR